VKKNTDKVKKETGIAKPTKQHLSTSLSFPVVGIGASAGGLEALEQFFTNLPKDSGMAFVIIQHLDPTRKDILPELLQRTTTMKVIQATDKLKIKPDCLYVIPPNKSMSVLNGSLYLFKPTELRGLRLPIDIFFRSLADDQKDRSIGIVLSGMGSDGSLGLKAIKEKNGIVLVQDPLTAKFNGMPSSAIDVVSADIIASANELPAKLISFLKYSPTISQNLILEDKNKTNLEKIVILLRAQTGHDFSYYKKTTLYRRIERRMSIHQIVKISNYVTFLQDNPKELDILFKELLIGVTNFFRDADVWEKLKVQVLPDMFEKLPNGYVLRVWVTGCSTGEEAYSFAIIFKEAYEKVKEKKNITLQIFATDIDNDAIEIARKGVFRSSIVNDVSPTRISKFFAINENNYAINNSIRELMIFAVHDVIKDPPFTKLDFLLCRNILIYMESPLQNKLMNLFYYSLNSGGIMVLGSAESVSSKERLFTLIDKKLKLYQRSSAPIAIEMTDFPTSLSHSTKHIQPESVSAKVTNNIQTITDQLLLNHFTPPSVLINQDGDILYISGKTGKYLEPAAGKANWNVFAMAREGLRNELLTAIRKARQSFEQVKLQKIKLGTNDSTQLVNVTVQHIAKPDEIKGTFIIVFSDVTVPYKRVDKDSKNGIKTKSSREKEMEIELKQTIEDLQSIREEMQTSQEELKSSNEELQSTNEELQSTNEELTTSKEEMQSLNEELQTVNIELQSKVNDYMEANNDMKNLLNSTEIATLFLDKELNIRRFTEKLTKIIKIRPTDIGRPFTDISTDLQYPEIVEHTLEVLKTLIFKSIDVSTNDERWFNVRIMPYRTLDDRIDGLVITFNDITEAKKLEAELQETIRILQIHNLYK
jgi:two-component system, chemotaxis family, CheB/CheR fusion protein